LYAAVNKNPDIEFNGRVKERDEGHLEPHFVHDGIDICHPFVYTKKDWIIQQYYDNNILDLLSITRSCEGEFSNIDYKTYKPGMVVPECGECFWCKEREWALEKVK
jgi:7-cyano-7-deazaguanine synthase in queuosine biosynthesis